MIVDCFAGVGGNAIAFALSGRWKKVYAIERDAQVLACARHNAQIYGVANIISWYEGDCFEVIKNELADLHEHSVVFASPPWGGWLKSPHESDNSIDENRSKLQIRRSVRSLTYAAVHAA